MRRLNLLLCLPFLIACSDTDKLSGPAPAWPDGIQSVDVEPNPNRPANIDLSEAGTFVHGVCEPTIINTLLFERPIVDVPYVGEIRSSSVFRPEKSGQPEIPVGPANDLVPGFNVDKGVVAPQQNFPGIGQTAWNPPDPALAVGPNHIVQTVNQSIAFFTKSGDLLFQQRLNDTDQPSFFDEVGVGSFAFDPKCFYDHYSNRFFVLALEVYDNIDESYITIAISDDDDPNGIWYKYRTFAVVDVGSASYWVDYPGLGFDENGYYVTGNLFILSGSGPGFGNVLFRSFDKTPLLNGAPAVFTDIRDGNNASVQVAQHFGGDNSAPYFVSRINSTTLRLTALNNPFSNPSFSTSDISIPTAFGPPDAPNGGGGTISTLDGRLMNVHWRNGSLWACHGVESGSRSVARWYEVSTGNWPNGGPSPSLVQSGNVVGPSGVFTFFPAIYTDANNNAAMVMAYSSNSEFASVRVTGRLSTDPLNTMGSIELLQSGETSTSGRWGDYFDIAIDPNDDLTFWMVGEYQTSGGWQSSLNSFSLFVLGDINGDGIVNLLDVSPFVEAVSQGTFIPEADINGDGVVNLLDIQGFVEILSN